MDKITVRIPKSKERISVNAKPIVLSIEGGYEKGYKDGYDNGKIDGEQVGYDKGYDFGYNTGHEVGYNEGETVGYTNGYAEGQNSVPNPLEYANSVYNAFKEVTFPTGHELTLNLPKITSCESTFYGASGIKKITLKGNESGETISFHQAFRSCASLETVDLKEFNAKPSTIYMMFYMCKAIREILGEIDFTECTATTYAFQGCTNLVTVTPKANSIKISIGFPNSTQIDFSSTQAIFDGLATVETAQTLTLNANQNVLQSQIDSANTKGWTVVGGKVVQEAW